MANSGCCVTKSSGVLVAPCEATPKATLFLSSIDRIYFKNLVQETMNVFRHGCEPARVLRDALSKALVPYYPMAGRFINSVEVSCTGEGVWFVEASANCTLEEVGWLEQHPLTIPADQLLPSPPYPLGIIVMIQVTEFNCGGFVVGFKSDHALSDGIGTAQFLNAVAEMARNPLSQLSTKPVWARESIPSPLLPSRTKPNVPVTPLETYVVDIPSDYINHLQELGAYGLSRFDLLTARLWQCRTRAINLEPGRQVHLRFAANTRHLLKHVLPEGGGYYGNCIYPLSVSATGEEIASGNVLDIASRIRDARKSLVAEFSKWVRGELSEDPYSVALTMGYELLIVSDWTRVGFSEVDYGWGPPAYVAPVMVPRESDRPPTCYVVRSPATKQGFRLMTRLVKEEHLKAFQVQINNLTF